MFSAQKQQPAKPKKQTPTRDTAVTILTNGCHFSGKLYCRGASRIGGKIEGQIISEGLLIIEDEAVITAEIKADEAIIQGRVEGKLHATGRVELCASSHFDGDIVTPVLIVREGAQFNGRSSMARTDAHQSTDHERKTPRIVATSGKDGHRGHKEGGRLPDIDRGLDKDVSVQKLPEVHVPSAS